MCYPCQEGDNHVSFGGLGLNYQLCFSKKRFKYLWCRLKDIQLARRIRGTPE